jgi:hypothetical protein
MVDDRQAELAMLFGALGNSAALNRSSALASLLENTANLSDGRAFFNTTDANLLTGYGTVSVTSIDAAVSALYGQATPAGPISGVSPRFLIVPRQLTTTAYQAVMTLFGDSLRADRVDVVVCPHLSVATTFYLMGDPATAPTLGLLHLGASADARTLRIERRSDNDTSVDGIRVGIRDDFRITRMSRTGILKVTA